MRGTTNDIIAKAFERRHVCLTCNPHRVEYGRPTFVINQLIHLSSVQPSNHGKPTWDENDGTKYQHR